MGSTTYFGRHEPDGRRLGADLDLLAKWTHSFACRAPIHSYYLTQLSDDDRGTLFSAPAQQFRLQEGPNNTVKLAKPEDGDAGDGFRQVGIRGIDPDVLAMMLSAGYSRSESRNYEMLCGIEDAQDDSQAVSAMVLGTALMEGMDGPAAEKLAEQAAGKVREAAGRRVVARWKAATVERLTKMDVMETPDSPQPASITPNGTQLSTAVSRTSDAASSGSSPARFDDNQTTPQAKHAAVKPPSPRATPSDHGSDTTVDSRRWSSPRYSTDESSSSPELDASPGFFDDLDGGAALLPSSLAQALGLNDEPPIQTPTPASRFTRLHSQSTGGHLGAGLSQAFFATPTGTNGMFAINPTTDPDAPSGTSADSTAPGQSTTPDASPAPFSPNSKTTQYPLAKEQPWKGFSCYEVDVQLSTDQLVPKYWTNKRGKERHVRYKIGDLKLDDAKLRSDRVLGSVARNPIHIFIDLSNIIIGFYDSMKESRGIPVNRRVLAPGFAFKNFDTILTRDRNVGKRIVAGSMNSYNKRPAYMLQAEELKYEMNILQRVPKPSSPARKRRQKSAPDSAVSAPDTSGDDRVSGPLRHGEQGVDELLHLKILQSAMDAPSPGTMVVATGDAAHAEYSDGFKKNIERVLGFGWNIELYGWKRNISSAWREPEFAERWGHQFKIVELDRFCEELFDMTVESLEQ
ncbi:hypothetical protein BT67DRAFT_232289 [Trichocladium antarcticum]|uniref:Uncharacterized protein n=1 Tax=Trichocladium antarcticum TaxID=1450529 RepID=A0AAN6UP51_9PEZI|nr:hypothetical protein BT67DRAFT_232289 [Trichocladium antarcticum]